MSPLQLPPPALDVALVIDHAGYQAMVTGSGHHFVTRFPSLGSLIHFARTLWSVKDSFPAGYGMDVECWGLRWTWKRPVA